MTETQQKAIEDLKCIIKISENLIKQLESNELDGIESETLEVYYQISKLDY